MAVGKVWLVGAGPGDIGLFTRKGEQVLRDAQVVVYDSLVGQGVLSIVPRQARCIDVGKRAGTSHMPRSRSIRFCWKRPGKDSCGPLKGGDPFLFGRGGEELELLKENQIPMKSCPASLLP